MPADGTKGGGFHAVVGRRGPGPVGVFGFMKQSGAGIFLDNLASGVIPDLILPIKKGQNHDYRQ